MRAGDVMNKQFEVVHPDAAIEDVAARLAAPDSDPIPVCEDGWLLGMIGHQDVAARPGLKGRFWRRPRVRDALGPDILFCRESTELVEAVALMKENQAHCLPVLDGESRLVGMLALRELAEGSGVRSGAAAGAGRSRRSRAGASPQRSRASSGGRSGRSPQAPRDRG